MIYAVSLLAILLFATLAYLLAENAKRYDIADVAWGGAFAIGAVTSFWLQPGEKFSWDIQLIATILVIIWAARLSLHIAKRLLTSKNEDRRYTEMRSKWKTNKQLKAYLNIFVLQGALAFVIVLPVIFINASADIQVGALAWTGVVIWLVGFLFEATADAQLRKFISNPLNKGKLMTAGVWRYSRHPNYFGEITQWWGIWLIACAAPYGWLTVIGPLTITFFIVKVSGVPLLEVKYAGRKDWEVYKKRTSMLIPLPKRV